MVAAPSSLERKTATRQAAKRQSITTAVSLVIDLQKPCTAHRSERGKRQRSALLVPSPPPSLVYGLGLFSAAREAAGPVIRGGGAGPAPDRAVAARSARAVRARAGAAGGRANAAERRANAAEIRSFMRVLGDLSICPENGKFRALPPGYPESRKGACPDLYPGGPPPVISPGYACGP